MCCFYFFIKQNGQQNRKCSRRKRRICSVTIDTNLISISLSKTNKKAKQKGAERLFELGKEEGMLCHNSGRCPHPTNWPPCTQAQTRTCMLLPRYTVHGLSVSLVLLSQ